MAAPELTTPPGESCDVLWPLGPATTEAVRMPARPSDLNGKRIGFIWDHVFRGNEIFDLLEQGLKETFPSASFVPYTAFGNIHGKGEEAVLAALPNRLRAEEVDAVIVGVGA